MVTKADLVDSISAKAGFTKKDASAALAAVLESIGENLAKGEKVSLIGFGAFEVKNRAARQGRNPATGEVIQIPARKAVTFKPSSQISPH